MRVLLIEDDALLRMVLSDRLADEGIDVQGLANAEDALILLGAGQVPDGLVTDSRLGGGLSGFDLAEVARAKHPEVGVILISGTQLEDMRHRLQRREIFLEKPFQPEALAAAIRQAAAKE